MSCVTFIFNSWAEPGVLSRSRNTPPAAAAYTRKNRKDIWDGSMPKTVLLHSPISSFSSGKKGWMNTCCSSHTCNNNMCSLAMTVFFKVVYCYIANHSTMHCQKTSICSSTWRSTIVSDSKIRRQGIVNNEAPERKISSVIIMSSAF